MDFAFRSASAIFHGREITVSVPDHIAELRAPRAEMLDRVALNHLDMVDGRGLHATRVEASLSSAIENVHADPASIAAAFAGHPADEASSLVSQCHRAILHLLQRGVIESSVLEAHRILLPGSEHSGAWRTMQNWIGGWTPEDAAYVPPTPEMIPALMEDFFAFVRRTDIHPILHASIAHAQFESIHPFHDGNGRIGRAIVSAMLPSVVPLSAHLYPTQRSYHSALNLFRTGDVRTVTDLFSTGLISAGMWNEHARHVSAQILPQHGRSGSAVRALRNNLLMDPVVTLTSARYVTGASTSSAQNAISSLEGAGVLTEVSGRASGRVWVARSVWNTYSECAERVSSTASSDEVRTRSIHLRSGGISLEFLG